MTFLRSLLQRFFPIGVLAACLLLAACSGDKAEDEDLTKPSESVEVLYNRARDTLAENSYKKAVTAFEEVEQQHPYSEWAVRSQIMSAYSSYKARDYDSAIGTLERFVKMHPNHESAPYAFYLTALCYYEQISDVGRDQKMTQLAQQALNDVIQRFPDTDFARDAKIKQDLVTDHLAGKEMEVGRYYLKRNEYLAAINRFKFVIDTYQTTSHTPEALHRLVESYLRLGVKEEATRYASVLGYNYPKSQWYRDSYALLEGKTLPESETKKGFLDKLIPKL